jgi:hypothetical protein
MWVVRAWLQRPQPYDVARARLESLAAGSAVSVWFEPTGEVTVSVRQAVEHATAATVIGLLAIEEFLGSTRLDLRVVSMSVQQAGVKEPAPDLVGVAEIAEIMKVSRPRAHQITQKSAFPRPLARLQMGPVFARRAVRDFISDMRERAG